MRSRFAAIARALLVLASSACIASTALAGIEAKDRLLAASAIVEEARLAPTIDGRPPAVEPSREHLWVVLPLPPKSPNDTTNRGRPAIGFGTGASNAVSVLLHAPAEAPGIINVVAEHASMPEAITAFGDAVYLVFRAPTFNRREVLVRRAEWNEATQRSFAVPPQGELLPSLPLDGDLIGLVADSRGLWALLVSSPAARYGVRRDGASESEPRLPSLMRLERSGWKLVPFPSWAASTRAASSANPSASDRARQVEPHVEPLTLVDGPRGARVLFRQGADLFLVDPLEESVADPSRRRVAVLPRVRHPLDGFDGRSAWFQTVNPLASQENPFAMTFGVVDWQLLNTPQGRDGSAIPLGVTTPSFNRPGSARSPLQIHWLPISEASLADGAEVTPAVATTDEVVIKGQAAGPTPKPWAVVRAADGLLLVTVTSPGGNSTSNNQAAIAPPSPEGGTDESTSTPPGDSATKAPSSAAVAPPSETQSIESTVQWTRIPFDQIAATGDAAAVRHLPSSALLQRFEATGFGVGAWIHIPLILMVGMAMLMVVAFVRVIRLPETMNPSLNPALDPATGEVIIPVLPFSRRAAALAIDLAIPCTIAWAIFGTMPRPLVLLTSWTTTLDQANAALVAIGLTCLHTGLTEWWTSKTLGKWLVGGRLVSVNGEPIRFGQAFLRGAFKAMILAAPILGIFTFLNREGRGIGDIASGTMVSLQPPAKE